MLNQKFNSFSFRGNWHYRSSKVKMKQSYLVTGASGYLGSHIAEYLMEKKKGSTICYKKI